MRWNETKRSLWTCAVWAAGSLSLPNLAHANDATFGGAGADLAPLSEQRVQMKSEQVVLTADGGEWRVEARYIFFNAASGPVRVQVGFPEFRCEDDGGDCADVAFRELETKVDGVAVKHRRGQLGKAQAWSEFLGVVWLFDVRFPPRRDVTVAHRYRLTSGADVEGNRYTSYVTRTGRGWEGAIGHATFTAVLPPYVRAVYDYSVAGLHARPPRLIQEEGKPRLELVVEGSDWEPEGGVGFGYNDSQVPLAPLDMSRFPGGKSEQPLFTLEPCDPGDDPVEAQRCLNELHAAKGYPFKNPAIARKYYSGNPRFRRLEAGGRRLWVRDPMALTSFSPSWFTPAENEQIERWSKLAARAQSPAAPREPSAQERSLAEPSGASEANPTARDDTSAASRGAPESSAATKERTSRAEPQPRDMVQPHAPAPSVSKGGGRCALGGGKHGSGALLAQLASLFGLAISLVARRRAVRARASSTPSR